MNAEEVKDYIRMLYHIKKSIGDGQPPPGYEYLCPEEFILKFGRAFTYNSKMNNMTKYPKGQCYQNAFDYMAFDTDLYYAEGYAAQEELGWFPFEHAWCVNKKGQVIDPTWDNGQSIHYFGVVFTQEFSVEHIQKQKYYGFIFNWMERLPLMKKGVMKESYVALKDDKMECVKKEEGGRLPYKYQSYWIKPIYTYRWAVYEEGTYNMPGTDKKMSPNLKSAEECEAFIRGMLRH